MKHWFLISTASIILTIIMIFLWFIIPGFPLLIFLLFPLPLYWWWNRTEPDIPTEEPEGPQLHYCPRCGKRILEPFQPFCPACGSRVLKDR